MSRELSLTGFGPFSSQTRAKFVGLKIICKVYSPSLLAFDIDIDKSLSRVQLFAALWTVAYQAPLSMGFSRRVLEWVAISFSSGSSWPRDWTWISRIAGRRFNLWATAEYIMSNAGLDEAQAGVKISRRNINNIRYADDTTLMAESEELKNLLKEESEKVYLKLSIQKTKIMASGPITSWQIDGETMETVTDFIFLGSKITVDADFSHEIKSACSLEEKLWAA